MAEEEATPADPPVTTEKNGEADTADKGKDKAKQRRRREDDTPIEELFDLSKPIPHVSFHTEGLPLLTWIYVEFLQLDSKDTIKER